MTSLQMRAISTVLRLTRKPQTATVEPARRRMADPKGPSQPPAGPAQAATR
jgi:monoterpene epsilon-lactone hydrolase